MFGPRAVRALPDEPRAAVPADDAVRLLEREHPVTISVDAERGLDVVRRRREARKRKTEAPRGVEGRRERDVRDRLGVGMHDGRQRGGHGGAG